MDNTKCSFQSLPVELRLLIYSFALVESPAITIGTAELVGSHSDIVHRLYVACPRAFAPRASHRDRD